MELHGCVIPERTTKAGEEIVTLGDSSKIKIHITGSEAQVLLHEGPPNGKTWRVFVRIEATET